MTFRAVFRFELAYQARRPWPWIFFAVLVVFAFLFTRDGSLAEAQYTDFFINSPFAIAAATVFGGVIWLLSSAAIAGEAAARDVATRMDGLTYTAPISKADYLGGRWLAAFVLNALILLAVPLGNVLAAYSPGVHPDAVGPFRPAAYLTAYAFLALPNAFVATALQFSLAMRSGRPMAAYLGSALLCFMGFFIASLVLFRRGLGTLLDPIGIRFIIEDIAHLWTTPEKSTRLLAFDGIILTNRLLWISIGLGVFAVTWLGFRFAHRDEGRWWAPGKRRRNAQSPAPAVMVAAPSRPVSAPLTFDFPIHARQALVIARDSFRAIAKSWAGLGLLTAVPLVTVLVVVDQMFSSGVPLLPTTGQVLKELTGPLTSELSRWVVVPIVSIFFAGELVWREREAGLADIADATPLPEWVHFLGKFLGLGFVLAVLMALLMGAGMLAQLILGYRDFQVGLYLAILFGIQLPEYLLFALLAVVVHVIVDQKYIGHLVTVIAYAVLLLAPMFGIEHDMLIYGAGPWWTYTEMRGLGPYVWPWLSFKLYWVAWALLLAVVARLFWPRGRESGLTMRLELARLRFTRATAHAAAVAVGLILTLGGFVFYNTNVLNEYVSPSGRAERSAEYERRYGRYAAAPQPELAGATLQVEIYPERREVDISGSYRLVNRTGGAIDSLHVGTGSDVETSAFTFDRPAAPALLDENLGHRIYALERPLQPGDSLRLDFKVHVKRRGFREGGADVSVVPNGTIFSSVWMPAIGYQRRRELLNAGERREHGLDSRPVIPSLYDAEARKGVSGGVAFDAVVGTSEDQVAVAPGALRRTWAGNGRRYFHYSTDAPIGGEWAFASAHYTVREAQWKDVAIRILHHPTHSAHIDRWVRSIRASLDYYTTHFGPYRYRHITAVEVPGDGIGIHADASILTHGEGITLLRPTDEPGSLDLPFAVMAHEMAHQWNVPAAFVEGAPVLSEGLAWYYAMKVVEHAEGPGQLRRLLKFMRQPYPIAPIRRGEPLLRGLDPYMSYRKGPFALYALSEYIGEDRVNAALRRLLEKHQPEGASLATTLDLYRGLQAVTPDSLQYLLRDWFEVNTYWELETDAAQADSLPSGEWRVALEVRARKVVYDSAGAEKELPMDEWVHIGVFGPRAGRDEFATPLYLAKHRIRSGGQRITVTVPRKPVLAGIDPYHVLDHEENEDDDNVEAVEASSR